MRIPLIKPYFGEEEYSAVKETLDSGWVAGDGPKCHELEEKLKEYIGVKHAIVVGNCTEALHLSLLATGIGPGDEVIVADYTYPATAHAVLHCGATPRFADANKKTYNIDPHSIRKLVSSKTKAIVPVHTFGQMANMDEVMSIAEKHDLSVVEDAACAIGATQDGKMAGTIGDVGCFSMHARKNVTTGEGGIVVTNDDEIAKKARELHYFGIESAYGRKGLPVFTSPGYNYKLSDIQASIGIVQLKRLDDLIQRRRLLARRYEDVLQFIDGVTTPFVDPRNKHIYQSYVCTLDPKIDRDATITKLAELGIGSQIGTYSCVDQPVYCADDACPVSDYLFKHSISLPMYYGMTAADVDSVYNALKQVLS